MGLDAERLISNRYRHIELCMHSPFKIKMHVYAHQISVTSLSGEHICYQNIHPKIHGMDFRGGFSILWRIKTDWEVSPCIYTSVEEPIKFICIQPNIIFTTGAHMSYRSNFVIAGCIFVSFCFTTLLALRKFWGC